MARRRLRIPGAKPAVEVDQVGRAIVNVRRNRADALLEDYLQNYYQYRYNRESKVGEKAYEAARVVAFVLEELQFEDPSAQHLWERIISGETIPR